MTWKMDLVNKINWNVNSLYDVISERIYLNFKSIMY